ncbi:MAG: glycosyl hydrolase 53 family protein [Eubacterium sp.]|nr:glycosyl hydrolase 53 family protein [Eubacterium sp.]
MKKFLIKICALLTISSMLFGVVFMSDSATAYSMAAANTVETPESSRDALKKYKEISEINNDTILGVDFTYYQQCLTWGKQYKNYMSQPIDNLFTYVKSQGINTISVKVAVNPTGDNAYLSLDNAIKTLKAAKAAGLQTNLVLLYSDEMTYAGTQKLPVGWTSDNATEKAKAYTTEVVEKLKKESATPTIITIGNEVDWNFLGITAEGGWNGWVAMGEISAYLKENNIKNAFSLAAPKEASAIQEIITGKLRWTKADYDYIGVNLYPDDNIDTYVENLKKAVESCSDKQLIISNVKYARTNEADTANVYTQADNIYNLLSATIDEQNAGGIVYDEAVYAGSWNSLFDEDGDAQISLAIFAYAQGHQTDTSRDPYKYGDDTGLKSQKVTINKVSKMTDSTIRGMDISSYIALKNAGVKYYDNNGNEASLLKVLSDNGVNYIRIRIWNDPYNEKGETYGGGASDVENGLKIAREAAKYNMKLLLCFHYSDFWAEPSVQKLPKAWQKDANNPKQLRANVYNYTKETIEKFKAVGANIGMVQIGNEISQGMMGVMQSKNSSIWAEKSKIELIDSYINAGAKAVRECTPEALIALHLDTLYTGTYKNAMDVWERDNVDYDVLGASSYAFWVGDNMIGSLKKAGEYVASRGKMFTILETSWLNSTEDADGTPNMISSTKVKKYNIGPQGQVDVLADMYDAVLTNDNGLGIFYWEGAWIPVKPGWTNWKYNREMADKYGTGWASQGAVGYFPNWKMYYNGQPAWGGDSWDNQTLFDTKGYPLDSLRFYKDAVSSKEKQQIAIIELCSQSGGIIGYKYVKVSVGKSITYTLPVVTGYKAVKTKIQIKGEKEGIKRVQATYKMLPKKQNIRLKKSSYKLPYASNYNFKKQVIANGKLTFKSSNSKVIYINKRTGKMTIKKPGKVTITINAGSTAFYKAAKKRVTVYAVPKKQTLQRVRKSGKTIKVTVKKDVKATGYQVITSTNKKFKRNKKTVVSKNNRRISLTLRQNGEGTYYIRARSYIKIGKKSYYASWSKVKKIVLK